MKRNRRETQIFSIAFLDVLSCALGGVLILLFVTLQRPEVQQAQAEPVEQTEAQRPDETEERPDETEQRPDESEEEEATEQDEGHVIRAALVVRLEWDRADVDIDLWVHDPSGEVGYSATQSDVGYYLQDSQSEGDGAWEEYHANQPHAGQYEVYAHYFSSDAGPVQAVASVVAFAGSREHQQRLPDKSITLTKPAHGERPGYLAFRFELVEVGDRYVLMEL